MLLKQIVQCELQEDQQFAENEFDTLFVLTYFRKIQAGTGSFSIRFASFLRLGPYLPH